MATPCIAIDLTKDAPPTLTTPYFIFFTTVAPQYAFLLNKTPRFNTLDEAFTALYHYEFEYDAHGHVCSKFGLEPDPRTTQPQTDISPDEDIPQ